MKKITLFLILILISSQSSFALNSSQAEMKYKKQKALNWYESHGEGSSKEIALIKSKAMRWYTGVASIFSNEMNSSKKKALRWHEKNNK